MEKKLLDLYIQAQPIFRRGGWQDGDRFAVYKSADSGLSAPIGRVGTSRHPYWWERDNYIAIRLPPIDDPDRPERSLLSTVIGFQTLDKVEGQWQCSFRQDDGERITTGDTPTEALLRAIIAQAQEGGESC